MNKQIRELLTPFLLSPIFVFVFLLIEFPSVSTMAWPRGSARIIDVVSSVYPRESYKRGTFISYLSKCLVVIENSNNENVFELTIPKKVNENDLVKIRINPKSQIPVFVSTSSYSYILLILFLMCIIGGLLQIWRYIKNG